MCSREKGVCIVTHTVATQVSILRALVHVLGILNYTTDLEKHSQ